MNIRLVGTPNQLYVTRNSKYTANSSGVISIASPPPFSDVLDLMNSGCVPIATFGAGALLGFIKNANMNVTTDQPFDMSPGWTAGYSFRITKITAEGSSVSLTTAAGGIYQAAGKAGTAIVAAAQAYATLTGPNLALDLTLAAGATVYAANTQPILSLTTPQGAAATANVFIYGDVYL
jgi:hypothetical protein